MLYSPASFQTKASARTGSSARDLSHTKAHITRRIEETTAMQIIMTFNKITDVLWYSKPTLIKASHKYSAGGNKDLNLCMTNSRRDCCLDRFINSRGDRGILHRFSFRGTEPRYPATLSLFSLQSQSNMHEVKDIIDVNNFVFCRDHGDELCHRCFFDHRPTNNFQIMDLPDFEGEEFELFNKDVCFVARRSPFNLQ
jgi:hypothetical protein